MAELDVLVPLDSRKARLALIHAGETGLKFRLGKSPLSLNLNVQLADVEALEADFTGYTPGGLTVAYATGYITPDGTPSNESGMMSIILPDPVLVANTVYFWWIDDGTNVVMCGEFPNPIGMASPGNALKVMIEDSYPPGLPSVQVVP